MLLGLGLVVTSLALILLVLVLVGLRRRLSSYSSCPDVSMAIDEIIWRGKKLPRPGDDLLTDTYRIHGCQSSAWLRVNPDDSVDVWADSVLARGLLSYVKQFGTSAGQLAGLELSAPRLRGLQSMVSSLLKQRQMLKL